MQEGKGKDRGGRGGNNPAHSSQLKWLPHAFSDLCHTPPTFPDPSNSFASPPHPPWLALPHKHLPQAKGQVRFQAAPEFHGFCHTQGSFSKHQQASIHLAPQNSACSSKQAKCQKTFIHPAAFSPSPPHQPFTFFAQGFAAFAVSYSDLVSPTNASTCLELRSLRTSHSISKVAKTTVWSLETSQRQCSLWTFQFDMVKKVKWLHINNNVFL